MKSRWTTCLLLTAAAAVWGLVAWKILAPASTDASPTAVAAVPPAAPAAPADTLLLDYPDPFLKESAAPREPARLAVRPLPVRRSAAARRSKVQWVHLGTVAAAGTALYILSAGNEQYELTPGGTADGFAFAGCDADSLYLRRDGIVYGVKLCR